MALKHCYFYVHRYTNKAGSHVDLVMALDDSDPFLFQPMQADKGDISALYKFVFALTDALEGGYSLFSCDSLRYGLRYVTSQIPVKYDGFRLVFNHYDIAFSLAVICKEDALLLPTLNLNVFGTMDMLRWIKDIVEGRVGLHLKTAWAEYLAERFGLTPELISLRGLNIMTAGDTYIYVQKERKNYTGEQFEVIKDHFRWMYTYQKEMDEIEKRGTIEDQEPYPPF